MYQMEELEISCVVQDANQVIASVGIGKQIFSVSQVAAWILNKTYRFYTYKGGYKAYVEPRRHHITGNLFLTTDPDDTRENNLDFLRPCY